MRTRKKEIEALANLLSEEHASVDDLATSVWKMVDDLRRDRELWAVAVSHFGGVIIFYGPYESQTMAEKAISVGQIMSLERGDSARLIKIVPPSSIFDTSAQGELFDMR